MQTKRCCNQINKTWNKIEVYKTILRPKINYYKMAESHQQDWKVLYN